MTNDTSPLMKADSRTVELQQLTGRAMNIGKLLTKSARTFPENLAIAYGSKELTYAEFNARANRLANGLTGLASSKGITWRC